FVKYIIRDSKVKIKRYIDKANKIEVAFKGNEIKAEFIKDIINKKIQFLISK
ncbi:uncharacterized protein B0T23DRAFT_328202, partial [Neurospora hispaniola]